MSEENNFLLMYCLMGVYLVRYYVNWFLLNEANGTNFSLLELVRLRRLTLPYYKRFVQLVLHQILTAVKIWWLKVDGNRYRLLSNVLSAIIYIGLAFLVLMNQ